MPSKRCLPRGSHSHLSPRQILSTYLYWISPLRQPVLVIFGDSLSDGGSGLYPKFRQVGVDYPTTPYEQGRFCNGPMWPEHLQQILRWRVHNHAVSCARVLREYRFCIDPAEEVCALVPSLMGQVQQYLALAPPNHRIPKHYVFALFFGGNDMTDSMLEGMEMDKFEENLVTNFTAAAELLIAAGARHLLVFGLPIPELVHNLVTIQFKESIARINSAAQEAAFRLRTRHNEVAVRFVNMEVIANRVAEEYVAAGKNVKQPCITAVSVANGILEFYFNFRMNYTGCDDPENHWLWDELHPSSHVHQRFAEELAPIMRAIYYTPGVDLQDDQWWERVTRQVLTLFSKETEEQIHKVEEEVHRAIHGE